MRAVSQRLLETDNGCPPTVRYLLKELAVLRELARRETVESFRNIINIKLAGVSVFSVSPGDEVKWQLYEHSKDEAALLYQQTQRLLQPWDDSWSKIIEDTKTKISTRGSAIANTDLTNDKIVSLIQEYEEFKANRTKTDDAS